MSILPLVFHKLLVDESRLCVVIRVELHELHTGENTYVRGQKLEWLGVNKLGLDYLEIGQHHGLMDWLRLLNRGVVGL